MFTETGLVSIPRFRARFYMIRVDYFAKLAWSARIRNNAVQASSLECRLSLIFMALTHRSRVVPAVDFERNVYVVSSAKEAGKIRRATRLCWITANTIRSPNKDRRYLCVVFLPASPIVRILCISDICIVNLEKGVRRIYSTCDLATSRL